MKDGLGGGSHTRQINLAITPSSSSFIFFYIVARHCIFYIGLVRSARRSDCMCKSIATKLHFNKSHFASLAGLIMPGTWLQTIVKACPPFFYDIYECVLSWVSAGSYNKLMQIIKLYTQFVTTHLLFDATTPHEGSIIIVRIGFLQRPQYMAL